MTDQGSYIVATLGAENLPKLRNNTEANFGRSRLETVVRYTSGPQTLAGTADLVTCDAAGGSFTVHLPAAPVDGDRYEFFKETAGNTLTIGRNGKNINFAAADHTLTSALSSAVLTWSTAANSWLAR